MRFASAIIKLISLVLLAFLFVTYVLNAAGYGWVNVANIPMGSVLVLVMALIMVISGLSSIAFDFYERSKWQNENVYNILKEKIVKLEDIEPKINKINEEHIARTEFKLNELAQKVDENSAKFEEYVTQFANMSVQVFSKDKQNQNMEHNKDFQVDEKFSNNGDYFDHYTEKSQLNSDFFGSEEIEKKQLPDNNDNFTKVDEANISQAEKEFEETVPAEESYTTPEAVELSAPAEESYTTPEAVELSAPAEESYTTPETVELSAPAEESYTTPETVELSAPAEESYTTPEAVLSAPAEESYTTPEAVLSAPAEESHTAQNEQSIDDILANAISEPKASLAAAERLSGIFNQNLADTLSSLEIMHDEAETLGQDQQIDPETYFSGEEKIKL